MFRRLGLQKRIVVYIIVGLALLLGAFSFVGIRAIQKSTELVLQERLAIAQSVASGFARDFHHISTGMVQDAFRETGPDDDDAAYNAAVEDTYRRLSSPGSFAFFRVTRVTLFDAAGETVATSASDAGHLAPTPPAVDTTVASWVESNDPESFVSLIVPLKDGEGNTWSRVVVSTIGLNSDEDFVPFSVSLGSSTSESDDLSNQSRYHLEVLTSTGTTILAIGPDEPTSALSVHYPLIAPMLQSGTSDVLIHTAQIDGEASEHVVAVAPIPSSNVALLLEQDTDVALAVPNELRSQFILVGSLGLIVAILVGWVTTRQVVTPTKQLAAATVRMAGGDLSEPIQTRAQDEIAVLAENLEAMRQQLRDALNEVETTNQELEQRVRERTAQLEDVVQRILTAQEEERGRIALELHDETAQALTALTMSLDAMTRRSEHLTPQDVERLNDAREISSNLLDGIRQMIYALRPVALQDTGLTAALRWYAEDYVGRAGATPHVDLEGQEPSLPDHVELALYRIGQEALNNVARHAHAKNVWVTITSHDSQVELTVRDDGIGFDPEKTTPGNGRTGGVGLAGMRERANLIGASLHVDSVIRTGTTVRVEVARDQSG